MRPSSLFPLFAEVSTLQGIGPAVQARLAKLGIHTIRDLLWHIPVGAIDRRFSPPLDGAPTDCVITTEVTIYEHQAVPGRSRRPYRVACGNDSGDIILTFFHARSDYIQRLLPVGEQRVVSGRVERYQGVLQMSHPDHVVAPLQRDQLMRLEPIYALTAGISLKQMQHYVAQAMQNITALPEWIEPHYLARQHWPAWDAAIRAAHQPEVSEANDNKPDSPSLQSITPISGTAPEDTLQDGALSMPAPLSSHDTTASLRLAYDELLANQLALAIVRKRQRKHKGIPLAASGPLREAMVAQLPFTLTPGQQKICTEIGNDIASPHRMLRLVQGDVGSGKTVVALWALLAAVEEGKQAALMAPTEIVARQHATWLAEQCMPLGLEVGLLLGADTAAERRRTLAKLAEGALPIVVGTHALFQDKVQFRTLAMVVIDEQHRFGVNQRLQLADKGADGATAPHMLLMTATPIPRTLTMTTFGDMDVSRLTDKPPGRKPVDTRVLPLTRLPEVVNSLPRAIQDGARIYWICPLIEESEAGKPGKPLAAVEQRFIEFKQRFPGRVGLVHGRIKGEERAATLSSFQRGEIDILLATTVIEVGVNVPEASVMVIEHAEQFGLAQLHQLRGRVGRGKKASSCLLLYQDDLSETGRKRLKTMRESEDGFFIAEEDMRIRGSGDILGTRQSGLPDFRFADLREHMDLALTARDDARLIMDKDPALNTPRGEALRTLLYLFEYDKWIRNVLSG